VIGFARTGTTKKRFVASKGPRAVVVDLVRRGSGRRARFFLDDVALEVLHPAVGDRMACEVYFDEPSDDEDTIAIDALSAVTVTAVHARGFIDVTGYAQFDFDNDAPLDVMLRRYPERLEWKVS
jgi:hypothetical protein